MSLLKGAQLGPDSLLVSGKRSKVRWKKSFVEQIWVLLLPPTGSYHFVTRLFLCTALTGHFIRYALVLLDQSHFCLNPSQTRHGARQHSSEVFIHIEMIASHSCCTLMMWIQHVPKVLHWIFKGLIWYRCYNCIYDTECNSNCNSFIFLDWKWILEISNSLLLTFCSNNRVWNVQSDEIPPLFKPVYCPVRFNCELYNVISIKFYLYSAESQQHSPQYVLYCKLKNPQG